MTSTPKTVQKTKPLRLSTSIGTKLSLPPIAIRPGTTLTSYDSVSNGIVTSKEMQIDRNFGKLNVTAS